MLKKVMTLSVLLVITLLVIWGCNEENVNEPPNNQSIEAKLANNLTVMSGASAVYKDTLLATPDSIRALNAMGQFIVAQESVKEAFYIGIDALEIYFNNGLRSSILLIPTDKDGHHLLRGGGVANQLSKFDFNAKSNSTKKIKNNKVLVLNPYSREFELGDYSKELELFESGKEKFEVTVVKDEKVGLDDINSFSDYGFIILNTHGLTYGFLINIWVNFPATEGGKKWSSEEVLDIIKSSGNLPIDKFENGELEINSTINTYGKRDVRKKLKIVVTEKYIRNSSIDLTDAILFGNHCYSGHTSDGPTTNNMSEAWRSKGLATYYGYSYKDNVGAAVNDRFCNEMEDSLIVNLVKDIDITGVAHLASNSNAQFYHGRLNNWKLSQKIFSGEIIEGRQAHPRWNHYFNQYFDKNYKYGGCVNKSTNMSATVVHPPSVVYPNGKSFPFEAIDSTEQQFKNGKTIRILLTSQERFRSISLTTFNYTGSGTFSLGGNTSDWQAKLHTNSGSFNATSGEITVIEDNETCITGNFSFATEPGIQVNNGKFLIKF